MTAKDYDYNDPEYQSRRRYKTEDGGLAHRIYQIPHNEKDLAERIEMMGHSAISTLTTGVFMALMSVKDQVAEVNPQYAANIERMYKYARDNDLRAAEVITDPKGDRKRRAHEQDDPDLYVRIVERNDKGIVVRGAKLHITAASLIHELVVMPTKGMRQDEKDVALGKALLELSDEYRQVIQLRNYDGLSFEEIGQCLGRSAAAARKLWGRALKQLQEILGCDDGSSRG